MLLAAANRRVRTTKTMQSKSQVFAFVLCAAKMRAHTKNSSVRVGSV